MNNISELMLNIFMNDPHKANSSELNRLLEMGHIQNHNITHEHI